MPGLMQCLDATFTLVGADGERDVPAREFYEAAYMTAREDDEVLTAVTIPAPSGGFAYEKQKRKIGDYATAAAAVQITKDGDTCGSAAIAMTNLAAMLNDIDPTEDNRGPIAFKKHVAGVILRRAIERAWSRA